jgi:hypothetical protein
MVYYDVYGLFIYKGKAYPMFSFKRAYNHNYRLKKGKNTHPPASYKNTYHKGYVHRYKRERYEKN